MYALSSRRPVSIATASSLCSSSSRSRSSLEVVSTRGRIYVLNSVHAQRDHSIRQVLATLDGAAPVWTTGDRRLRQGGLQRTTSLHYVRQGVGRPVPRERDGRR